MSALSQSSIPVLSFRNVREVAVVVAAIAKQLRETLRHRREAAQLAAFDDHMLADIGLTRGDLHDAYAEPWFRDPSDVLMRRARERRAAHRRGLRTALARVHVAPSLAPDAITTRRPC